MKAIAVVPGSPCSVHSREVSRPAIDDVTGGRGVRVSIIRSGLCGTDADLAQGLYGTVPDADDYLVIGHESLGRVSEVGPAAGGIVEPGQLVVVTIRRPGSSDYDHIGLSDLTSDPRVVERGISRQHGFLVEEIVDDVDHLVAVPETLEDVAILTEPLSCVTKALRQVDEVQHRLRIWQPRRVLVIGAGTIGLLASLALRLRGLEVTTYSRRPAPYRNSELVEQLGARYVSAAGADVASVAERHGPFDLVFECAGAAQLFEPAVHALAPNGVLALFSVTPRSTILPIDVARLNHAMVLANRAIVGSAAASPGDYSQAVETLGRAQGDVATRGWLPRLLTTPIEGLDADAIGRHLGDGASRDAIKATVEISRRR